ncbi:MAG TPA: hypothetical protein PLH57_07095, partial [Oligoflexia bacterium]|nr:hypothetical protein [Oligoflexia bacterium]
TIVIVALVVAFLFKNKKAEPAKDFSSVVNKMRELVIGLDIEIGELQRRAKHASEDLSERTKNLASRMTEQWAQVRVIAINGAIEATKDPELQKRFQRYFDEIGKTVTESRELCLELEKLGRPAPELMEQIKDLDELLARVADDAIVFSPRVSGQKRRPE